MNNSCSTYEYNLQARKLIYIIIFYLLYLVSITVICSVYGLEDSKTIGLINYAILFIITTKLIIYNIAFEFNTMIILCIFLGSQMLAFIYSNNFLLHTNMNIQMPISFSMNYLLFFSFPLVLNPCNKLIYKSINFIIGIGLFAGLYEYIIEIKNIDSLISFFLHPSFAIQSFCSNRNSFGFLMAICIMLCVLMYLKNGAKLRYILFGVFLLINLLITLSRASYVTIAAFTFFFILMNSKKRYKIIIWGLLLCSVIMILYLKYPKTQYFVSEYMIRVDKGTTGRNILWEIAISRLDVVTILIGNGLGISREILSGYNTSVTSFHNIYLDMLLSGGIFYILIFLYLIKVVFQKISVILGFDKECGAFFIACIISLLIYGFFEVSMFFYLDLNCLLETFIMFTLPILFANNYSSRKEKNDAEGAALIGNCSYI